MDEIDRNLVVALQLDGSAGLAELAKVAGLSVSATAERVKRLEERGVIRGWRAVLDAQAVGRGHVAFVEVKLSDTREAALAAFNRAVLSVPEIEACHMIAGSFDYLLKVRTAGMPDYRALLAEKLSVLPHVEATSTYVAMETVKEEGLPASGGQG